MVALKGGKWMIKFKPLCPPYPYPSGRRACVEKYRTQSRKGPRGTIWIGLHLTVLKYPSKKSSEYLNKSFLPLGLPEPLHPRVGKHLQ